MVPRVLAAAVKAICVGVSKKPTTADNSDDIASSRDDGGPLLEGNLGPKQPIPGPLLGESVSLCQVQALFLGQCCGTVARTVSSLLSETT